MVVRIVERVPARYQVEGVSNLGRCYRWCPEQVVVECGQCKKRMTFDRLQLITSIVTCGRCGARRTVSVREELLAEQLLTEGEVLAHPWRYWRSREETGIPV